MGKKNRNKKKKLKKQPKNNKKKIIVKPQTVQELKNSFKRQARDIKNKMKRVQLHAHRRGIQNNLKMKQRKKRQKLPAQQRQQPQTIQDKQLANQEQIEQYQQANLDQFNQILNDQIPVKILLTTSIKPPTKIYDLIRQLMMVFHNINYYPRYNMTLDQIYGYAKNLNYTHVIVVRFSHGWQLLIRHLEGVLAVFKVSNVQYQKNIINHGIATDHVPQLILNNFDSKVGVRIGRLLASLFPQQPEFRGRRVVTFHNQRDFIFFRHHRYIFTDQFNGVNMQQIGPKMTLRLKKLYSGNSQKVQGIQFDAKDKLYVDRKAVYL